MNLKVYISHPKGLLISIVIHPIAQVMNVLLFTSIYAHNGTQEINGYSLAQMIWYFAVTIMVWIFIWNFADRRMSNYILSGDLGVLLLRPISLFRFELANAIALRTAGVMFEFFPDFLVYSLIYPPFFLTLASLGKFLAVVVFSFFLYFMISFVIGLSAIITQNNASLNRISHTAISLLGGVMIPLEFYPKWLQQVCDYLPFKYIFYMPVQFFLNREAFTGISTFVHALAVQLVWIIGLYALYRIVWVLLIKRVIVAGG